MNYVVTVSVGLLGLLTLFTLKKRKKFPELKDKVVLITGASSGIGEALAYLCYENGAQLILSSTNEKSLNAIKQNCIRDHQVRSDISFHPEPVVYPINLENVDQLQELGTAAAKLFDRIDYLFNNAGISMRSEALQTKLAVDTKMMSVNFLGPVQFTKGILPTMIQNKFGHIVIMSSVQGYLGLPNRTLYAASKFALHGYFESLRHEVYDKGISVTIMCPQYVKTKLSHNALTGDGSSHSQMDKTTENGYSPRYVAEETLYAIHNKEMLAIVGGIKVSSTYYLARIFPNLLFYLVQKATKSKN